MKNIFRFSAIVIFLFCSSSWAVKQYYRPSGSVRADGMGGAFYGLSNDEYALFYNPAGLSIYSGNPEGGLRINGGVGSRSISALNTLTKDNGNIQTVVDKMTEYQGTPLYAQVGLLPYYFQKHFGVGLLLADTKVNFALLGKELDSSVDVTAVSDSGLYIGYGRPLFLPELHIGGTVKAYYRAGGTKTYTLAEVSQKTSSSIDPKDIGGGGAGIDADIGATYIIPHKLPIGLEHRVSLVFNNLISASPWIAKIGNNPPRPSRTASLGWYSAFQGVGPIDNFHFLFDIADINLGGESDAQLGARTGSIWKHVNFGLEAPISFLALRIGMHQGNISGGFGLNLKVIRFDVATYAEEVGLLPGKLTSRIYRASLMIGWASAPLPPVTATAVSEDVNKLQEPKKEEPKAKEETKPEANKEAPGAEQPQQKQ